MTHPAPMSAPARPHRLRCSRCGRRGDVVYLVPNVADVERIAFACDAHTFDGDHVLASRWDTPHSSLAAGDTPRSDRERVAEVNPHAAELIDAALLDPWRHG